MVASNSILRICAGQALLADPEKVRNCCILQRDASRGEAVIASSEGMQAELVWWPACQGGLPGSPEALDPPLSKPATVHHPYVTPRCLVLHSRYAACDQITSAAS